MTIAFGDEEFSMRNPQRRPHSSVVPIPGKIIPSRILFFHQANFPEPRLAL
jgi:hypothetical protein